MDCRGKGQINKGKKEADEERRRKIVEIVRSLSLSQANNMFFSIKCILVIKMSIAQKNRTFPKHQTIVLDAL